MTNSIVERSLDTMPESNKNQPEKVRVNLVVTKEIDDWIEKIAEGIGCSKGDVLRRGLALMRVAYEAKDNGESLGVFNTSGQQVKQLVGIL